MFPPPPSPAAVAKEKRYGTLVEWRGSTATTDRGEVSLSFDRADGSVMRLRMSGEDARQLAESLLDFFQRQTGSHSDRSSGRSSSPVSTPLDGENV